LGKSVKNSIDKLQISGIKNEEREITNLHLGNSKKLSLDILIKQWKQKEKISIT
jgi:hypothetical protein